MAAPLALPPLTEMLPLPVVVSVRLVGPGPAPPMPPIRARGRPNVFPPVLPLMDKSPTIEMVWTGALIKPALSMPPVPASRVTGPAVMF